MINVTKTDKQNFMECLKKIEFYVLKWAKMGLDFSSDQMRHKCNVKYLHCMRIIVNAEVSLKGWKKL